MFGSDNECVTVLLFRSWIGWASLWVRSTTSIVRTVCTIIFLVSSNLQVNYFEVLLVLVLVANKKIKHDLEAGACFWSTFQVLLTGTGVM